MKNRLICSFLMLIVFYTLSIGYNWFNYVLYPSGRSRSISVRRLQNVKGQGFPLQGRSVSLCMGIAVRGKTLSAARRDINELPLISYFVPSFCATASPNFNYFMYMSYDFDDPYLKEEQNIRMFKLMLMRAIHRNCGNVTVQIRLFSVPYSSKPAWAQNDAVMQAYIDGTDYLYRVNDDTLFVSRDWTNTFANQLAQADPVNVGLVGPTNIGRHEVMIQYEFTHRTHVDIFGFYYPRLLKNWYGDAWISHVYGHNRGLMLPHVKINHTRVHGRRYSIDDANHIANHLGNRVAYDKKTLDRYIKYRKGRSFQIVPDGSKVISMSLFGNETRYTYGAIRNAQLTPVVFPGWKLRIYTEEPNSSASLHQVPLGIIHLLQRLGADIYVVQTSLPPIWWRYLVADDLMVDFFIIRGVDGRLSNREFAVVEEWIKDGAAVQRIKGPPKHMEKEIQPDLWGARPKLLRYMLGSKWSDKVVEFTHINRAVNHSAFLNQVMWPKVKKSCFTSRESFEQEVSGTATHYIGQTYDEQSEPDPQY